MVSLEEQIKRRKKQAEDRQIEEKADFVASGLGKTVRHEGTGYNRDRVSTYKGRDLVIESTYFVIDGSDGPLGGSGTEISYKGKEVFKTSGARMDTYIPGKWEALLDRLYTKAIPASEKKERQEAIRLKDERTKKESDEKAKWGL